jgi:hypothetical protein
MNDADFVRMYAEKVKKLSVINRALQAEFRVWAEAAEDAHNFEFCNLAQKRLFIESAIGLMTRPKKEDYGLYLDEQIAFFSQMSEAIRSFERKGTEVEGFTPFRSFHGAISEAEQRKNRINERIARIGNGALLYAFRAAYLNVFVRGRSKVHGRSLLKMLYSE